jgi:hypothetical protein
MSSGIIVQRVLKEDGNEVLVPIAVSEWKQLVDEDPDLRWRAEPYSATNPRTGERIKIPVGAADSEICMAGEWFPFLRFFDGSLETKYQEAFEDPRNAARNKIAAVAKRLGAVITTDAGDDQLRW